MDQVQLIRPLGVIIRNLVFVSLTGLPVVVALSTDPASASNSSSLYTHILGTQNPINYWAPIGVYGGIGGVSCPSATFCIGVGLTGDPSASNGNTPLILGTANGGTTWTMQQAGPGVFYLTTVSCGSTSSCVALGISTLGVQISLATTDGGKTWFQTELPAGFEEYAISCPSATTCFAAGDNALSGPRSAMVIRTTDGGTSWSNMTLPASFAAVRYVVDGAFISCPTTSACYATFPISSSGAFVVQTSDGGVTWSGADLAIPPAVPSELNVSAVSDISCPTASTCLIPFQVAAFAPLGSTNGATTSAGILITSDGGRTWNPFTLGNPVNIVTNITCWSISSCVVIGGDVIYSLTISSETMHLTPEAAPSGPNLISVVSCSPLGALCVAAGFRFVGPCPGPGPAGTEFQGDLVQSANKGTWSIAPGSSSGQPDQGYILASPNGTAYSCGDAPKYGQLSPASLSAPVVGVVPTADNYGYWEAAADGGVFTYGDANFYGSMGGHILNAPVVGMAASPDGKGYWLAASDGGVFTYGDANFYGSMGGILLNAPILGISATPDGKGYWLFGRDGGVFTFGDAQYWGTFAEQPGAGYVPLNIVAASGTQ